MARAEHTDLDPPQPPISQPPIPPDPASPAPADAGPEDPPTPAVLAAPTESISRPEITWMLLANFGASMAYIVPLVFSLALRVDQLAPGHAEILGYLTGVAQLTYLVASPLLGLWSDRTRSRFGRRRPFMIIGLVAGGVAVVGIALVPTIPLVGLCWVIGVLGLGTTQAAIINLQADRLPEEQRAKVSGLTGLAGQVAPVIGISAVAGVAASSTFLVFAIPAAVGAVLVIPFLVLGRDADSRTLDRSADQVSIRTVVASYGFNPRRYPDFAWNWFGRFVFFLGLYANTTFAAFFYSQRLGVPISQVATISAAIGLLGVVAALVGAIGGGFLSDRLRRRKLFTMIGAVLFAGGAVVEAFAYSFPALIAGALLMNLAIAAFTAVDQAIVISVLPDRAEAGRYMAVVSFAQKIPSGVAPLLAPFVLAIGMVEGQQNYTLLYLAGGVLAVLGGLIILTRVKSVR